ncbi:hypothetical protein D3867_25960 (plasmid) [Azospirillum argentinense]|uniref:Uncharacterized protein n=1 Tax=Azospirillum brasilense TaxID=192 RepID=A0A4D8QBJ7_AZOBR|nr:hypothetical protein D3867_25960 [Azospirillum argentinense]
MNGFRLPRRWRTALKADCNPLWTAAAAVPVAHATGARLSREHRSRWRQADAMGIRRDPANEAI